MLPAGPHQHLSKQHQCGLLDAWLQLYKQVGNQALACNLSSCGLTAAAHAAVVLAAQLLNCLMGLHTTCATACHLLDSSLLIIVRQDCPQHC
jgi:hypothetical protein